MDNGLVLDANGNIIKSDTRLNPYCSGQWSRTSYACKRMGTFVNVLILIVVDNGLVHFSQSFRLREDGKGS